MPCGSSPRPAGRRAGAAVRVRRRVERDDVREPAASAGSSSSAAPRAHARSRRRGRPAPARGAARGRRRRAPGSRCGRGRRAGRRSVPRHRAVRASGRVAWRVGPRGRRPGRSGRGPVPPGGDRAGRPRVERAVELGAHAVGERRRLADDVDRPPARAGRAWRSTRRGSTAPLQRLTSSRTAASTGSPGAAGSAAARAERDAARAGAAGAQREGDVAALPHRPGVVEQRGRARAATGSGLPGRRARGARAPRPARARARPRHDGVDALGRGTRSSGRARAAWATNASRNASTRSRAMVRPAAARCPPWRIEVGGAGVEPGEQVEGGDRAPRAGALLAVERDQDGRAVMALGEARGDDPDHARGASPRPPARRRAPAGSRSSASASKRMRVSTSRRSALTASSSRRPPRARSASSVSSSSSPASARCRRPAALMRGASRKPIARASTPRVHARDRHQRLQPRLAGAARAPQAGAHEPPVLAHAAARRRRRWRARRGRGPRRPPRGPARRPRAAPGRACAPRRPRTGPGTGSRRPRVDDRGVRQGAVGPRRVVVGDHDLEPRRARRRHLVDRGDRAVGRDQQAGAAGRQPLDGGRARARSRPRSGSAGTSRPPRPACAGRGRGSPSRTRRRRRSRRGR